MLGQLRTALGAAWRGLHREPLAPLLGAGTVAVGFALTGFLAVVASDLGAVAARGAPRAEMVVELADDVDPSRVAELESRIQALPSVESVRRVSPGAAMERLRHSLGSEARVLDGVEADFLPTSLEVRLGPEGSSVAATTTLAERLERTAGVARVVQVGEWVQRLGRLLEAARWVVLVALALAGAGSVYVVGATARLRALARRDEIEILKLVGATDRFVRAPFLIEGAAIGGVGAAAGAAILHALAGWLRPVVARAPETAFAERLSIDVAAAFPAPLLLSAIGVCVLLCALAASLSVGRHSRV